MTVDTLSEEGTAVAARDDKGRFAVGGAGGPGRPRGKSQADIVREYLEPHRQQLLDAALTLAKDEKGEPMARIRALEMLLSRIAPRPREEAEKVYVPGFHDAANLQDKATAVIAAAASGDISADAATKLLQVLDMFNRAIETSELRKQVDELLRDRKKGRRGRADVVDVIDAAEGVEGLL